MVLQIETFPGFFFLPDSLNEHHKLQDILWEILLISIRLDYGKFTWNLQELNQSHKLMIMGH